MRRKAARWIAALCGAALLVSVTSEIAVAEDPTIVVTYEPGESEEEPATLTVRGTEGSEDVEVWVYSFGDGESASTVESLNDIAVTTPSPQCTSVDEHKVSCPLDVRALYVHLGAGRDYYSQVTSPSVAYGYVQGGAGRDDFWISFGHRSADDSAAFRIAGGDGADYLWDASPEVFPEPTLLLTGGPGNDVLTGAAFMEGGKGEDQLTNHDRSESIMSGGPGADTLESNGGDDSLSGGAGADRLRDFGGNDVVYGGTGTDLVRVDDGGADDVNCGSGRDTVSRDWRDHMIRCERKRS